MATLFDPGPYSEPLAASTSSAEHEYAPRSKRAGIVLPPIDCVDDHDALRIMADMVEEDPEYHTRPKLVELLRRTARLWELGYFLTRAALQPGMAVWARYGSQGWSVAEVATVGPIHISVDFPRRWRTDAGGDRAWWDLKKRRPESGTHSRRKPKIWKGYGVGTNCELAAAIMRASIEARGGKQK